MNPFLKSLAAAAVLGIGAQAATAGSTEGEIAQLLSRYESALNNQRVDDIVALYAEDGVFMAQHSPPKVGSAAIRQAYQRVFATITLAIDFEVDEIVPLSPDWAYARTRSSGSVTINASGAEVAEANQELFLLQREAGGGWRIARYIFATTNPPRA